MREQVTVELLVVVKFEPWLEEAVAQCPNPDYAADVRKSVTAVAKAARFT